MLVTNFQIQELVMTFWRSQCNVLKKFYLEIVTYRSKTRYLVFVAPKWIRKDTKAEPMAAFWAFFWRVKTCVFLINRDWSPFVKKPDIFEVPRRPESELFSSSGVALGILVAWLLLIAPQGPQLGPTLCQSEPKRTPKLTIWYTKSKAQLCLAFGPPFSGPGRPIVVFWGLRK